MNYRSLGRSGLRVSSVGLGCNNFGTRCDAAQTRAVVDEALDLGVTLFDTADVYSAGQSEQLLGKALGARRQDVVIATKFGLPMGTGEYARGGSRRYVRLAVEASLVRLGTDWIDLYQIHFPDPSTPLGETVSALDDLIREGKIRYAGCSNYAGWQLVESLWIARTRGYEPFVSAQNHYNLIERTIERDLAPAAEANGVGILPYFPLESGLLTGKYRRGKTPGGDTRLGGGGSLSKKVLTEANFAKVENLTRFAEEHGKSLLDLAFGWLLARKCVASVIAGATKPEQVEANVKAGEWTMSPEDVEAAGRLTAPESS